MQSYGILLADAGRIALTAQSDRFTAQKWEGLLDTYDLELIQVGDFEVIDSGKTVDYTGDCNRLE